MWPLPMLLGSCSAALVLGVLARSMLPLTVTLSVVLYALRLRIVTLVSARLLPIAILTVPCSPLIERTKLYDVLHIVYEYLVCKLHALWHTGSSSPVPSSLAA